MWKKRIRKIGMLSIFCILLPFTVTVFWNGIEQEENALDVYCVQVLANEVSDAYEEEMLKAQAVLVRTRIYKQLQEEQGELALERQEIPATFQRVLEKVWQETKGQVLMYQDQLALAPFHKLSNGRTRNGKEVLGTDSYPYLKSVQCPKDVEAKEQIQTQMVDVKDVKVTKTDSAGYVSEVKVGGETVSGEQFRSTYQLPSGAFLIQAAGERSRVTTSGVGHGLGLSQYTANELAKEGKNYKEILEYFFAETKLKEVAEVLVNVE